MKAIKQHEILGTIVYEEGVWSGKKKITIDNVPLVKKDKKTFVLQKGEENKEVRLIGNFFVGTKLCIDNEYIQLTPSAKWYEILCGVLIFLLNIIWGNSVALCSIIPIVSGAIGGAISGLACVLCIIAMKSTKNVAIKLAIWLASLVAMMLICFLLARAIIPLLL